MTERRALEPVPGMPSASAAGLDALIAHVEAEAAQSGSALRAVFTLENTGADPLELRNPIDLLRWQLIDAAGAPVALPERVPTARLHRPAEAEFTLDSAIPIVAVEQDGEPTDASVLNAPVLRLARSLSVTFAFELAGGGYALVALVTLIEAAEPARSSILRSEPLSIKLRR